MPDGKYRYAKQAPTPGKTCKDCRREGVETGKSIPNRPAPHPGPRCTTHHNAEKRRRRLAAKQRHVTRNFDLTPEEYDALYEFQGGKCALCRVATGARKRLAVDHDHHQAMLDGHAPTQGCKNCVRALVCSTCNDVLAHARSDRAFFARGYAYLTRSPMKRMIAGEPWDV